MSVLDQYYTIRSSIQSAVASAQSELAAGLKAEQDQLDAFLFGHTHKPLIDRRGRTLFLNPGSVGKGLRPTYAVLTAENGRIDGQTVFLD